MFHTGILGVDSIKGDESMPLKKGVVMLKNKGLVDVEITVINISYVMLCGAEHHHPPPV